jgi:hypothetical protein
MSEAPKRLLDDPGAVDPELSAQLRSDLRVAKDAPSGYDVEGGLARLSATIGGGSAGGGHGGSGSGPGPLPASPAATSGGSLAVKVGVLGLAALGAIGGALAVRSAPPPSPPSASAAATITLPAPTASSALPIDDRPPQAPASAEPPSAPRNASAPAPGPRGVASAAPSAGATIKPEMDQLGEIRRALASEPGRALALAEEGHARFPRGVFWQEREVAAINALVRLGRAGEAKARARAFVARHPESPFAEGLRTLAEGD